MIEEQEEREDQSGVLTPGYLSVHWPANEEERCSLITLGQTWSMGTNEGTDMQIQDVGEVIDPSLCPHYCAQLPSTCWPAAVTLILHCVLIGFKSGNQVYSH